MCSILEYYYRRRATVRENQHQGGFVPLHSRHLKALTATYPKYINWMVAEKIFEPGFSYVVGKYAMGYRLLPPYDNPPSIVERAFTDRVVANAKQRLDEYQAKEREENRTNSIDDNCSKPIQTFLHITDPEVFRKQNQPAWVDELPAEVLSKWREEFKRFYISNNGLPYVSKSLPPLEIPTPDEVRATYGWLYECLRTVRAMPGWREHAQALLDKGEILLSKFETAQSCMMELAESVSSGAFRFAVSGGNGRVHTVVTSMPRCVRPYLTLDGCDDLVSIDLRAAQPYFLLPLAREVGAEERDIHALYDAIRSDLYTELAREMYGEVQASEKRESVKKGLMFALYAHQGQWGDIMGAMWRAFGKAYGAIRVAVDEYGNSAAALFLQRLESDFMVKLVSTELRRQRIPTLTVHDCVIVPRQYVAAVGETITRLGEAYTGFVPEFKVEPLLR